MKASLSPHLRLIGIAMLMAWLGPGLAWAVTGSVRAAFFAGSISSAFLGLVFLIRCLPLAQHMDRFQRMSLGPVPKVVDAVLRHGFGWFGWPHSTRGWVFAHIGMAVVFLVIAVLAFFWATGDTGSEQALTGWINDVFRRIFAR